MISGIMDWMTITTRTTTLMTCIIIVIVISPPLLALSSLSFVWLLQPHTTVAALPHGPPASRFWFFISGSWFSFLVQKMYDGIYKDWFKRPSFHSQKPIIGNWPKISSGFSCFICFKGPSIPTIKPVILLSKISPSRLLLLHMTNLPGTEAPIGRFVHSKKNWESSKVWFCLLLIWSKKKVHQKGQPDSGGLNSKFVQFYSFLLTNKPQSLRRK